MIVRGIAVPALALASLIVLATPVRAQINRDRFSIVAQHADTAPRIDGVLDEEVWRSATPIDQFTQQEPHEGEPATERTEVRVLYDARHIFIAVHAYDSQPAGIIATEMRRDADRILDEDSFQVIVDTFNDSRNGYMFVTTPLGAKLEQQISEEGEGNLRGTNSNVNRNWDGVWDAAARRTADGWTAEISIPTATLRFKDGEDQTWGVNFMRNIRRKNEQVFWAPVPKAYGLTRVSLAGTLTGLRSLSQGLDLKFKPFLVTGVRHQQPASLSSRTSFLHDYGFDGRYGLTSGLNLDVTYNTDFAQVEVDQQQVNLTRFDLFFPEKRDFFLENAGMFNMGTTADEADLFFSRRIGLSDNGEPIPIIGGTRLAGKVGKHSIALLDIQTDRAFDSPGDNFFVGRYSRDVLARSRVGALMVNKESVDGSTHFNRTIGADTTLALLGNLQINSFIAKTSSPNVTSGDMGLFGRVAYRSPAWNLYAQYLDLQDNFNPEVGFVPRRGVRVSTAYFSRTPRPRRAHIRLMEPMLIVRYTTDQHNRLVTRQLHHMVGITLDDGSFINVIVNRWLDVLDQPFPIRKNVTIPTGTYRFNEVYLTYNTSPARRLYETFTFIPQQFYGGKRYDVNGSVGFRGSSQLAAELQYQRSDVRLPAGKVLVRLAIARVDYALSPRMTIRSLTQYNSSTREVTNSLRFNFTYRPGSDLYVVYNDSQERSLPAGALTPSDRQFVIKFNYLLDR